MEFFLRDGVVGWSAILQHHPFAGGRIRWLTTSSNVRSLWDTGSNFRAWWKYGHEQGDNGRRGGGWRFPSWKKGTAKLMEKTSKLVMNSWIESLKSSKFDEKNQRTLPRQAQVPEVSVPAEERPWKAQIGYWGSGPAKFAAIVLWKADLRGFLSWDFSVLLMCVYFTKYMTDVSFSKELAVWLKCLTTGMIPDLP